MHYATGASLGAFPEKGIVFRTNLNDLASEIVEGESHPVTDAPILGLLQTAGSEGEPFSGNSLADDNRESSGGRIVSYGDSNCLDNSHMQKDCFWLLDALLEYTMNGHTPQVFLDHAGASVKHSAELPTRMENSNLHKHSKVIEQTLGLEQTKQLPECFQLMPSVPDPLNISNKNLNMHVGLKLLTQPEVLVLKLPSESHPIVPDKLQGELPIKLPYNKDSASADWTPSHSTFWLIIILSVVMLFLYWYRTRNRPKRRRNKFKKVMAAINNRLAHV